jgi:hypothetical protein
MIHTLCTHTHVPDCDFFINKRDFPLLSLSGHEPYDALVPPQTPLHSHHNDTYMPILSMCTTDAHADLPIPTWEDWARVKYMHSGETFPKTHSTYDHDFVTDWATKTSKIVFRGSSTGLGVTRDTNPRLFFAWLATHEKYKDIADIGITKWNMRPRKHRHDVPLDIPHIEGLTLVEPLTPCEQSQYKYILHLPGHSCAYRLSYELATRSVIFLFPSQYTLWYFHLLKPYVHYIPLEKGYDENELYEKWLWCEKHSEDARRIAQNAWDFYTTYLSYDGILQYMAHVMQRVSSLPKRQYIDLSSRLSELRRTLVTPSISTTLDDLKGTWVKNILTTDTWVVKKGDRDMCEHSFFVSKVLSDLVKDMMPKYTHFQECAFYTEDMIFMKRDPGMSMTLFDAFQETRLTMEDWKKIAVQIMYILEISQQRVGFIHYDLTPWNILVYTHDQTPLEYIFPDRVMSLTRCRFVVKIIDLEYAHVMYKDQHVHRMNPFFMSRHHDMCTFIIHSFSLMLKYLTCTKFDVQWMAKTLRQNPESTVRQLKRFLSDEKKFSRLVLTNEQVSDRLSMATFLTPLRKYMYRAHTHPPDWTFPSRRPLSLIQGDECIDVSLTISPIEQMERLYMFQKYIEHIEHKMSQHFQSHINADTLSLQKQKMMRVVITLPADFRTTDDAFVTTHVYRWVNFVAEEDIPPSLSPLHTDIPVDNDDALSTACHLTWMMMYLRQNGYTLRFENIESKKRKDGGQSHDMVSS